MFSLITRTVTHGFIVLLYILFFTFCATVLMICVEYIYSARSKMSMKWRQDQSSLPALAQQPTCCGFPSVSCTCHMFYRLLKTVEKEIIIFMLVEIQRRAAKQKMEALTGAPRPLDPCSALSLFSSQPKLFQPVMPTS